MCQFSADGIFEHVGRRPPPISLESRVRGEEGPLKKFIEVALLVVSDVVGEFSRKNDHRPSQGDNLKDTLELVHSAK